MNFTIDREKVEKENQVIFNGIRKMFGMVPNIFYNAGVSPQALKAYINFSNATQNVSLSPQERQAVYLIASEVNECNYCLAAHVQLAKSVGLSLKEIFNIRKAKCENEKINALVLLAKEITENRAKINPATLDNFYSVGYSERHLVEVIALICEISFMNYLGKITQPEIDFEPAPLLAETEN